MEVKQGKAETSVVVLEKGRYYFNDKWDSFNFHNDYVHITMRFCIYVPFLIFDVFSF